ncbi:hypothetical protein ABK040_004838 [Willaertia magna]
MELSEIYTHITSKVDEQKQIATEQFKVLVEKAWKEQNKETFSKFIEEIYQKIGDLLNSRETHDKIGALTLIDVLIDIKYDDQRKITKFSQFLKNVLLFVTSSNTIATTLNNDSVLIVILISKTFGKLASSDSLKTLTAEWVENEIKRALEWLQTVSSSESKKEIQIEYLRRQAAVLILKELAENASTLFYAHVPLFLKYIWNGLCDTHHVNIRTGSVQALHEVMYLISERQSNYRMEWYQSLHDQMINSLKSNKIESVHGGLLVTGELLAFSANVLRSEFDMICNTVLGFQNHKEKAIRKTVIDLIPKLAKFYGDKFNEKYLHKSIHYILESLKNGFERPSCFLSLGELALRVGQPIKKYTDEIFTSINDFGLKSKKKSFCEESLTCIGDISKALGDMVSVAILHSLPGMFAGGLTTTLIQSLAIISREIPVLSQPIQHRLLDSISQILARQPFPLLSLNPPTHFLPQVEATLYSTPSIVFALTTLGSFNIKGYNLIDFVNNCVVKYLDDDGPLIRKEAAKTCCRLLVSQGKPPVKGHFGSVVGDVLAKLLIVGITDSDASIRHAVLSSLEPKFDHYLALSDNLRSLFIALNDEVFAIREVAIHIIGRLSIRNPAFVLPSLRKALLQLLTELEYSQDARGKEESARMIGLLIDAAPNLIKPYVSSILKVLMEKIKDPNPIVATSVLDTIGKLSEVGGVVLSEFIDDLLPPVIETLQDQSSSTKRAVAIKTLGQIVESTGFVIAPYVKYPNLLTLLLTTLKGEEEWSIRREIIKVIGILGAIDPNHHLQLESSKEIVESTDIIPGLSPSSEEYYPTVAFNSLIRILTDSSLSIHHMSAIETVMFIFTNLGLKCVPFLPQIMPPLLSLTRTCGPSMRNDLFQQFSVLVSIVKQHIRVYLDDIFQLINEFWDNNASDVDFKEKIIHLEEQICLALNEQFKPYLTEVIPQILNVLQGSQPKVAKKALQAMTVFGRLLEDYLYLIIPAILQVFESNVAPLSLKRESVKTIGKLSRILNFSEYSSRIIHPLTRALKIHNNELRAEVMDTLCCIIHQLGSDFSIFIPMVTKVLTQYNIVHQKYNEFIYHLLKNLPLPPLPDEDVAVVASDDSTAGEVKKMTINQANLQRAWDATQRATKEDWTEWIRGFSIELLKESPSPALRNCAELSQVYYPLAKELFNAGFISCWSELGPAEQSDVVRALELAFSSPDLPPEVLQTLLNLAEFMEHNENPLPIAISALSILAESCACYAKALHYKEIEFQQNPSIVIEGLISINNQLHQHEAAMGILKYAQKNHSIELKETWYEKLQRWKEAYHVYDSKQKLSPNDPTLVLGKLRCLRAMGEWEKLLVLCNDSWFTMSDKSKEEVAPLAAAAAWQLAEWKSMKEYVSVMSEETREGLFYRAILSIHNNDASNAQVLIDKTRRILDTELAALVGESYNRAYDTIVAVQQLSELEEIIRYQKAEDDETRMMIHNTWIERLRGCKKNVEYWQDILSVRKLVISEKQDLASWLKFASICRKSKKMKLSEKTLQKLVDGINISLEPEKLLISSNHPKISFQYFKHMWEEGKQLKAFELLKQFVYNVQCDNQLKARAFLTLGKWQKMLSRQHGNFIEESKIPQILTHFKAATDFDKEWYKAWHEWALMNSEVVSYIEKRSQNRSVEPLINHIVSALNGYFNSINLSPDINSSLQDILRLLTLWFKHGSMKEIEKVLIDGFNTVSIDTWLEVIPQIIARINSHVGPVRKLIHKLLAKVSKQHPQALVYPLTVCTYSQSTTRKSSAEVLLNHMRQHSPILVEQASMVSHELIRVAILWNELWHDGLEEASRLYFGEHDVPGMLATLRPLHEMIQNPDTLSERAFIQGFGRDLQEAWEYCIKYQKTRKEKELTKAWDSYYQVFRRINKQLPHMMKLELQYVSPKLLDAESLELAVPGTYKSGHPVIRIASMVSQLRVIGSKQRPRKLKMYGSDGSEYQFLLKGREDLRQDERVMQLFGLVNTLLKNDPETCTRDLSIKRMAVIPLSSNAGLIEWVDNCDTLHSLIKEYRDSRNILLNLEHRLMLQMAANEYDNLTLMQKIEVFEYALENTQGQDLHKVLWLKSKNSEVWLERRTNYTRSLAVMSIVGYILGLGDRHPSNLMLEKSTGKIVHIDFGDCFEVAMHRDKFPEKVPFRLTRMLINAMEVCGIEGTFRATCESVMRVLRENKDSVMAMLEAFVHDPLINWRLLENQTDDDDNSTNQAYDAIPTTSNNNGMMSTSPTQPNQNAVAFSFNSESEHSVNYPSRSIREKNLRRSLQSDESDEESLRQPQTLNQKALLVSKRIEDKLIGRDFVDEDEEEENEMVLDCSQQVELLIEQATSNSNLCQLYIGWCPFW